MLKLMTTIYKNPVGRTLLGLIFAFLFGTVSLFLTIFAPNQLGMVDAPFQIREIYQFDQWTINYNFLTLEFPEGGYIIPGYRKDRISSMLIIGKGMATFEASNSFKGDTHIDFPIVDQVSEVVIPIHHEDFDRLKRDTIFVEAEITYPTHYILERLESSKGLLFNISVMGFNRNLLPTPRSVMLRLISAQNGDVYYIEDKIVSLRSDNLNYTFNHPIGESLYPAPNTHFLNILYNLMLTFAFLGLIAFLTTDYENKIDTQRYLDTIPAIIHVLVFTLYIFLVKWLSLKFSLGYIIQLVLYIIPVIYLGYWLYISKVPLSSVGITIEKFFKSIFIAIIIFYLLFISITFELIPPSFYGIISLLLRFILIIFIQFQLRGFIQNTLDALTGKYVGLVITSAIVTLFFIIDPIFFNEKSNLHLIFIGYFCLSTLISYAYQRTSSILTPALLTFLLSQFITNLF